MSVPAAPPIPAVPDAIIGDAVPAGASVTSLTAALPVETLPPRRLGLIRKPGWFTRGRLETRCNIEVEHSQEALGAHVVLDDDVPILPGDRVRVHGAPVRLRFGETVQLRRDVTVERASLLERQLVRLSGLFALAELYEVSFTDGRL